MDKRSRHTPGWVVVVLVLFAINQIAQLAAAVLGLMAP